MLDRETSWAQERCEKAFAEVRRAYFPRWDKRGEWRIVVTRNVPKSATAYCDSKDKTILVNPFEIRLMPNDGLRSLLIHEICHDVGAAGHNLRWAQRMEAAAKIADRLKELTVSRMLRGTVYGCCDLPTYRTATGLVDVPPWPNRMA